MWYAIVLLIVLILAAVFLQPDPQQPSPQDFTAPDAKEGKAIKVLFGTNDVQDYTTVWFGDVIPKAIRKKGGKK